MGGWVTAHTAANDHALIGAILICAADMGSLADAPRDRAVAAMADDGLAPGTDALVRAIQAKGRHQVTAMHVATDHSWSDRRIVLESEIIKWLGGLH